MAAATRTTIEGRELSVTNLDKVLFPASGFTKGQLIDYYVRVAPAILPHVRDRPLTLKRFPDGVEGKSFFEKHIPSHAPDWVRSVDVSAGDSHDVIPYVVPDLGLGREPRHDRAPRPAVAYRSPAGAPGPARSHGLRPRPR
jgi:hypothetical protein